jgi:hypothetical protein
MWTGEVVVLKPGGELQVAFRGGCVIAFMGPFAQGSLDEAFCFAVGAWGIRSGEAVRDAEFSASGVEQVGAIGVSVVGKQMADGDAVLCIECDRSTQEGAGGLGSLIGKDHGEGQTRVIVNGHVQRFPASELRPSTKPSVASHFHLLKTGHALDIEVQQVAGRRVFVTHRGRSGMQVPPTA